jgi:hypothetical protein
MYHSQLRTNDEKLNFRLFSVVDKVQTPRRHDAKFSLKSTSLFADTCSVRVKKLQNLTSFSSVFPRQ